LSANFGGYSINIGCIQQKLTASEILEKMQEKYESMESYKAEIHQKDIADGKTGKAVNSL